MRRTPVALAVAALAAVPLGLPASASSPTLLPVTGCYAVPDVAGDVADQDLDLLGLSLRTTATSLQAYLRVSSLQNAPRTGDAHRFAAAFVFRGHRFAAAATSSAHGESAVRDLPGSSHAFGGSVQLSDNGVNRPSGLTASFDLTHSYVVLDVPLDDLIRYAGGPASGTLTTVEATSAPDGFVSTYGQGDSTVPVGRRASTSTYVLGDNHCFGPAPAVLSLPGVGQAQYGDLVPVSARLTDAAGRALAGRTVALSLAGQRVTATTSSDGLALASFDPRVVAGSYPVTASFAGDAVAGGTQVTATVTVVAERTLMTLRTSGRESDRFVVATLKDDDGQPVVGASVTLSQNGQSSTFTTSSRGVVELHDVARNTKVTATFSGISGQYAASSASFTTPDNNGRGKHDED